MAHLTTNRKWLLTVVLTVTVAIWLAGCSSAPDIAVDLQKDEIGCLITFGDSPARSIGPVKVSSNVTVDISSDTKVTIGNSRTSLHVSVDRGLAEASETVNHSDIPSSGYVLEDIWIDTAHPGYRIVCTRG